MKKRRAFGVVATVLVAVLAVTQASALGSASEGRSDALGDWPNQ